MEDSIEENENNIQNVDNSSCEELENNEDYENKENEWNQNYEEECKFQMNLKNIGFIYLPSICQKCKTGINEIKKLEIQNIMNPYYVRYNNKICRKRVFPEKIKNRIILCRFHYYDGLRSKI